MYATKPTSTPLHRAACLLIVLLLALASAACGDSATPASPTAPATLAPSPTTAATPTQSQIAAVGATATAQTSSSRKPGYIVGRVTTEDGRPLPHFTISYSGYAFDKAPHYDVNGL